MEQKLVLSSQIAREKKNAINTPNDFTTVFDRPIVLGRNQRYVIGLDKVNTMTYSWHNVSPEYRNSIILYHNGKEYKRIEFSNGCYDYTELSDYIKETLIANDVLEPDQASAITIKFDLTSFNDFGNRWCKREYVEPNALKKWKVSIFEKVDQRIKFYSQNTNLLPPKPKSTFRHLKQGIQDFHRKYVLVPADKAANNVVVV